MEIAVERITVHPKRTFAIARSASDAFEHVTLTVREAGSTGRGEAAPTDRYGESAEAAHKALEAVEIKDPWDIEGTLDRNAGLPPSALSALDAALHDLAAKRLGVPVYRLLGLGRPAPTTAYTLGIADRQTTLDDAREFSLSGYQIFKMKVGSLEDLETVRAVAGSSGSGTEIWVDANEVFALEEAVEVVRELRGIGISLIEQPVPAAAGPEALRAVTQAADPVPVIADESAVNARDVPGLAGSVSGVNVKLAKCGGIRGALEMIHTARASGMRVMLGCMVETSLGIAAATHFSGLVDYVDLDGFLLLADDPFYGLSSDSGRIAVPEVPGFGVEPR